MVQDFIIDETGDLVFENGDMLVSASDNQHLTLIVNLTEGSLKEFPTQGVGIIQYTGSDGQVQALKRSITVKATADGYSNINVTVVQLADNQFKYNVDAVRL